MHGWMGGWMDEGRHDLQPSWLLICEKQDDGKHNTHIQRHKRKVIEDKNAQKFAYAAPPKNKNED